MKESAQAALSYIRSNTEYLQISEDFFEKNDADIQHPSDQVTRDLEIIRAAQFDEIIDRVLA